MAGSFNHCVDDEGRLLGPEDLCGMLECSSGDVVEAVEEMYGMIWLLADRYANSNSIDVYEDVLTIGGAAITTGNVVEWARQNYQQGLEISPGVNDA